MEFGVCGGASKFDIAGTGVLSTRGVGQYPFCFFFCFFLAEHRRLRGDSASAYATFRCFCFQFCSVFGGQICFKEAIMLAHEICYFVVVHASPFPLQPVFTIYLSFPAYLLCLALAGDIAFFFYRVHNIVFNACMYACSSMHICKVYICVHTTPRHIPHFVAIRYLCYAAGVKRSNSRGPTTPRETVGPRTLSTFIPLQ